MDAWMTAADTLPPAVVHDVIARLTRLCRGDEALEGAALPAALLSVASGRSVSLACGLAVKTARIDRHRSEQSRMRAELEASVLGGDTEPSTTPRWEDVRSVIPDKACRALDALTAHLLSQSRIWERLSTGSVKVNGAICSDALGLSIDGKSKRAVSDMRAASLMTMCAAWSEASAAMGNLQDGESKDDRTERAYRWVKRGHSNRFGRVQGAANGTEVRVTRRVSVSAGFTAPNDGEPVRSVSYRPTAPVKRIRSPRTTDGVAEGVPWGGGGAVGMPSREGRQTLGHSDRRLTSEGWVRHTRDDMAAQRTEREDWETALAAGRVGICPTVDDDGLCQCPRTRTRGKACERVQYVTQTYDAAGVANVAHVAYLHPLSPCERPTDDGRCGCSRKAGALVWVAPSPEAPGSLHHQSAPRRTR